MAATIVIVLSAAALGVHRSAREPLEVTAATAATAGPFIDLSGEGQSLDLGSLVAGSSSERLADLPGALFVLDPGSLGPGWVAGQWHMGTELGIGGAAYYEQEVELAPVRRNGVPPVTVAVRGRLDGGPVAFDDASGAKVAEFSTGERVVVRDGRGLSWQLQDGRVRVTLRGHGMAAEDLHELISLVSVHEAAPEWAPVFRPTEEESSTTPLLRGVVRFDDWSIVESAEGVSLVYRRDGRIASELEAAGVGSGDPAYRVDPWPGGSVLYGLAEGGSSRAILEMSDGTMVNLPVAGIERTGGDLLAFVVPIDDRLDPARLHLADDQGNDLSTVELSDLPPFLQIGTPIE